MSGDSLGHVGTMEGAAVASTIEDFLFQGPCLWPQKQFVRTSI